MNILTIPINEIRRAKYNPRKPLKSGDPAYDRLKKAVDTFGLVEPLVWNERSCNLVGGHQRLSVLEERGDTHVEVSVVDLDDRQEKALNLALNKQGGEWDYATLSDMLNKLDAGDIDMEITGFSEVELEKLMTWTAPTAGLTDEDAVPDLPTEPVSKISDIWLLGKHRLMCGDSTVSADVDRLLAGATPNLMVTDPPYGVNYDATWRDATGLTRSKQTATGKVENDDRSDWSDAWILFPGNVAYVWHAGVSAALVAASLESAAFEIRSQIIWAKQGFVFGRGHYHWQHEPCWYAVKKGATGNWLGDHKQATLWEIPNSNKMKGGSVDDQHTGHGTQKPIECMKRPILNHTASGQSVYEPFSGSGTTIIAAEATGRICYAMEISPAYCDVAVQRWEEFTGKKAERV